MQELNPGPLGDDPTLVPSGPSLRPFVAVSYCNGLSDKDLRILGFI